MPHINRSVVMACNESHGKWRVRLDCGHSFLCSHDVTQPGAVMACPKCEEAEEDEE